MLDNPTKQIGDLKVHPLANVVPMMSLIEQKALQQDIEKSGLRHPVVLYRGRIVDGRCRTLACLALGTVPTTTSLSNNLSLDEVRDYVKSENTRRNLTPAQKSIIAVKERVQFPKMTIDEMCTFWGITRNNYYAAQYIVEWRPDMAEALFNGQNVLLDMGEKGVANTQSVQKIAKWIRTSLDSSKANHVPDEFSVDAFGNALIKSNGGREWFKEMIIRSNPNNESVVSKAVLNTILAELANELHPEGEEPVIHKGAVIDSQTDTIVMPEESYEN